MSQTGIFTSIDQLFDQINANLTLTLETLCARMCALVLTGFERLRDKDT